MNILPLMTHERIVGILIWAINHDILDDEIFALADMLPLEYVHSLEDDLNTMIHMLKLSRRDAPMREAVLRGVQGELASTLKLKGQANG